jgi:hypothetical protein
MMRLVAIAYDRVMKGVEDGGYERPSSIIRAR